jgi:hypothetical protein
VVANSCFGVQPKTPGKGQPSGEGKDLSVRPVSRKKMASGFGFEPSPRLQALVGYRGTRSSV